MKHMLKNIKGGWQLVRHLKKVKKILSKCPAERAKMGLYKKILDNSAQGNPVEFAQLVQEKLMPHYCPKCKEEFQKIYAKMAKQFPGLAP